MNRCVHGSIHSVILAMLIIRDILQSKGAKACMQVDVFSTSVGALEIFQFVNNCICKQVFFMSVIRSLAGYLLCMLPPRPWTLNA